MTSAPALKARLAYLTGAALPDVDVFVDRMEPAAASAGRWVNVHGGGATVQPAVLSDSPDRYDFVWELQATLGSGPAHGTPEEADRTLHQMMKAIVDAVDADPSLNGLVYETILAQIIRNNEWSSDTQQTVISLVWYATSRGF